MDETEKYQARIFAALDKISRLVAESESREDEGDRLRERDAAVLDDLEATLADERADLIAERATAAELRQRLDAATQARLTAETALSEVERAEANALREAQTTRQDLETRLASTSADFETRLAKVGADLEAQLKNAEVARQTAGDALKQAETDTSTAEDALSAAETAREMAEQALEDLSAKAADIDKDAIAALEAKIARLNERIETQDLQFKRLKDANTQLRESNGVLRDRNANMLGDPSAIDLSMQAELESLRATRAADVTEMDTILQELKPLVEGKIHA